MDPVSPVVLFIEDVDEDSIAILMQRIEAAVARFDLVEVVVSAGFGDIDCAVRFGDWLQAHPMKSRVRAVAAGEVYLAGVLLVLAFERRTADPTVAVCSTRRTITAATDPWIVEYLERFTERLIERLVARTRMNAVEADAWARSRDVLGEDRLWETGICNDEKPVSTSLVSGPSDGIPTIKLGAPILFIGEIDKASIRALVSTIEDRLQSERECEVVISTSGGALNPVLGFASWLKRLPQRDRLLAVACGKVGSSGVTLFLAFERRTAHALGTMNVHPVKWTGLHYNTPEEEYEDVIQGVNREFILSRGRVNEKMLERMMHSDIGFHPDCIGLKMCTE